MAQQYRRQQEQVQNQTQTFYPNLDYNQLFMIALQMCVTTPPIPGAFRAAVYRAEGMVLDEWKDEQYREEMRPVLVRGHLNMQGNVVIGYEEEEYTIAQQIQIDPYRVWHCILALAHRRGIWDTSDSVSLIP